MIKSFFIKIKNFHKVLLFFIFYVFYNIDLSKIRDKFKINTKSLKYANDANILVYNKNANKLVKI
jgi:hypothetical protein